MHTNPVVGFFTLEDVRALCAFARLVEELPSNNVQLNEVVDGNEHLTRWLWRTPRLINCADITGAGKAWPPLRAELKLLVSKIELIGDQLEPLGTDLLETLERALALEEDDDSALTAIERPACGSALQRLALFTSHANRGVVLANGVRDQAHRFTHDLRTQALPSLRKLLVATNLDCDESWFPGKTFEEFRALLWRFQQDDTVDVGASALLDVCALLHDYIQAAAERLAAIQDKVKLLESILCLEEVLNLWREVRRQARQTLEVLA